MYKFQLFVDLDINTLQVVFNELRNFIVSVFIFYFSISFGATKFTSPRASNYLRPALVLPCDLSLTTIHISDRRHFSDTHISQGSVATCLMHNGIFKHVFVAIYYRVCSVKKV